MKILTFDIEEWSLYTHHPLFSSNDVSRLNSYLDQLLDLLEENNIHATFFCLGSIARSHPLVIKRIHSKGHHIGSHSDNHLFFRQQGRKQIAEDTRRSVYSLSELTGEKTDTYRAPAFSITPRNPWVLDVLLKEGITTDSSIFPATRSFGGFPRI
jgi:peptidoglycan/xylan/chitin deacetylase (PgdA/CDA1 family)